MPTSFQVAFILFLVITKSIPSYSPNFVGVVVILSLESIVSHMQGKCSTIELYAQYTSPPPPQREVWLYPKRNFNMWKELGFSESS